MTGEERGELFARAFVAGRDSRTEHPITSGAGWKLHQADSLRWLEDLAPDSLDALITDPPYSSGGQFRGDRTPSVIEKYQRGDARGTMPEFYGDTRDQRGMLAWSSLWLASAWRAMKDGGIAVVFSDWRMLPTFSDALQAGGFVWRGIVPWAKTHPRPQLGRFAAACEYALWGSKGPMPTDRGVGVLAGFYQEASVPGIDRQHVTEKPVSVMRSLVKIAPEGALVCDPFAGSGSTGVAALLEGRRFIGCELSPDYHKIASDRFTALANHEHRRAADRGQIGLFAAHNPTETETP